MANIIPLKDNTGAQFYPQTHEKAVVDSNGVNLQTKLASITTPTYVTAWDGDSTPVVANIPAGVTVTYNTTSYTGTLAASASTANKTYLVSTGTTDNYNRYVTQLNGSTYSWQNLGSTEIDLSDYATKEELNQLDQEVKSMVKSSSEADLDISDEEGEVIVRFSGGNVKTKNFDSVKVAKRMDVPLESDIIEAGDLDIADGSGHVLARFSHGSFKVKDFDSAYIPGIFAARDTIWSWWTFPSAILTKEGFRRKLMWGFCDTEMNIGVCERDEFGSGIRRTNIAVGTQSDDHNAPAIIELPNGHIAAVYARGHNSANGIFYRISTNVGDTSAFGEEIKISTPNNEKTAYAQVFNLNGLFCIFTRFDSNDWAVTTSTDFQTWTPFHVFLDSDVQYYVKFAKVTDQPNVLRFATHANPDIQSGTGIRLGLIDFSSGNIYNGTISPDNIVGTLSGSAVLYTSFSTIVATPTSPSRNRLLDIADTPLARVLLAYSTFTNTDTDDGEYYIYDNGVSANICSCGEAFYLWKYQGGISFINPDNIVVSRNEDGQDFIELWANQSGTWGKTDVLRIEKNGSFPVRNIRPIVDGAQMFVLWQRGYYDPSDYHNFDTDSIIANINSKLK